MPVDGDPLLLAVEQAMARDPGGIVGLAVSGGGDSMAMLHLFARAGVAVRAVTVDHALRDGSAAEAVFVAKVCAGLGIGHDTLIWAHGGASAGNLMAAASTARHRLMADWAARQGIGRIAVAHTADDQAETLLMGLSRSAGLDGLVGMRPEWHVGGIGFFRPLLQIATRQGLRDWLRDRGLDWRDDPSNEDDRFLRIRARRAITALRPLGVTPQGMAASIRHLAAARDALNRAAADAFAAIGRDGAGALHLSRAGFLAMEPDLSRRLLVHILRWMTGADHPPRAAEISRLAMALEAGRDATLWGCRFRSRSEDVLVLREGRAVAGVISPSHGLWDNRWRLAGPAGADTAMEIRALGAEGLRLCKDWRDSGIPREVLLVSPAVWQDQRLIAAPLAGFANGWTAKLDRSLPEFILSH